MSSSERKTSTSPIKDNPPDNAPSFAEWKAKTDLGREKIYTEAATKDQSKPDAASQAWESRRVSENVELMKNNKFSDYGK
ncbi:hypothetical protein DV737_g1733, partial [Chaetothyriales sp. CBS 132003]